MGGTRINKAYIIGILAFIFLISSVSASYYYDSFTEPNGTLFNDHYDWISPYPVSSEAHEIWYNSGRVQTIDDTDNSYTYTNFSSSLLTQANAVIFFKFYINDSAGSPSTYEMRLPQMSNTGTTDITMLYLIRTDTPTPTWKLNAPHNTEDVVSLSRFVWHNISLERIDFTNYNFTIFVDGVEYPSSTDTGYVFGTNTASWGGINFYDKSNQKNNIYIDDLCIGILSECPLGGGAPPIPTDNFTINVTDSYTGDYIYYNLTFTYNGTTHNYLNTNHTSTFATDDTLPANITISSAGYDTLTLINYDISAMSLTQPLNLTYGRFVFDSNIRGYSGTILQNYTIYLTNSTGASFSCVADLEDAVCIVPKNDTYNITIDVPEYSYRYYNLTYNGTPVYINVENITIYSNNSVYLTIYDASNNSVITWDTIYVVFSNDYGDLSYSTTNGTLAVSDLTDGNYSVRLSGDNYSLRTYDISVAERSYQFLNAYLLSSANNVIIRTYNIYENVVPSVSCSLEQVIGGTWQVVEVHLTDITGRAQFSYAPAVRYRFTCSKTDFLTKVFILDPILFSTYNIIMESNIAVVNTQEYAGININYYPKIFTTKQNGTFTFVISSPDGTLTDYGFNLSMPNNLTTRTGNNAYGESFTINTYFVASSILDKVNLTYYYDTTNSGFHVYTIPFGIVGEVGDNTIIKNIDKTYGLGILERTLIGTFVSILASGVVFMVAGVLSGGLILILMLGYLTYIGFLPFWVSIISIIVGFIILAWRSSE